MHKLLVAVSLVITACGSVEKAPPPEEAPVPEAPVEPPLPTLSGDDQVPGRFRTAFGRWLRDDASKSDYQRVVSVSEVSNAVSIVLERKLESDGNCRIGPSTLDITEQEGQDPTVAVQHYGEDCCPGTTCQMAPESWNLRYLKAVADKDVAALSALVPAKKKLAYELTGGDGKTSKKSFTRKDIAAGKLANPPGCGFTDSRPSCQAADPKTGAFQCSCHGGGYQATFDWVKEGDAFVVSKIVESSH